MDGEFYTFEDLIRYYPKGQAYLYWNRATPPSGAPVDGAAEHGDSSHKWDSRDSTYDDSSDRPWGHRTDGSDSVDGAPGLGLQEIQERSVGATEHTFVHIMLRQEDLPELQLAQDTDFEAGLRLRVYGTNGELILESILQNDMNAEVIRPAVLYKIAAQERIPRCCVGFVWKHIGIAPHRELTAQLELNPLTEEEEAKWTGYMWETHEPNDDLPLCMVCYYPCDDADFFSAPRTRELNCIQCHPAFICEERSVQGLRGRVCLLCVREDPEEIAHLPATAMTRLLLVDEQLRKATPLKLSWSSADFSRHIVLEARR